jgi:hypothetical protein
MHRPTGIARAPLPVAHSQVLACGWGDAPHHPLQAPISKRLLHVPPWRNTYQGASSMLRLVPGACLHRAQRFSRAGERAAVAARARRAAPPQLAKRPLLAHPRRLRFWQGYTHARSDFEAAPARDGGRSAPNGRAARNRFRGPPPTRAWTQHAGPAPLHAQGGARKPLYHCPAPRRNLPGPGCPVGHRCTSLLQLIRGPGRLDITSRARGPLPSNQAAPGSLLTNEWVLPLLASAPHQLPLPPACPPAGWSPGSRT